MKSVTPGDKTPLQENMYITIHPGYMGDYPTFNPPYINYTDGFWVKDPNGAKLLSRTPQEIIVVPM